MPPEVLEGMDLLEESRAKKWEKEQEVRADRRAQGIMYDEEVIDGIKVKSLYQREYYELYDPDRDLRTLLIFIGVAMVSAVIIFLGVKANLQRQRRKRMVERRKKLYEEVKARRKMEQEQQELKEGAIT